MEHQNLLASSCSLTSAPPPNLLLMFFFISMTVVPLCTQILKPETRRSFCDLWITQQLTSQCPRLQSCSALASSPDCNHTDISNSCCPHPTVPNPYLVPSPSMSRPDSLSSLTLCIPSELSAPLPPEVAFISLSSVFSVACGPQHMLRPSLRTLFISPFLGCRFILMVLTSILFPWESILGSPAGVMLLLCPSITSCSFLSLGARRIS